MSHRRHGFTLVEVAIVVAVIALLTTIVTVVFVNVQAQSRDSKRANDISVLANALEKYYDQNGLYPAGCGLTTCANSGSWNYPSSTTANTISPSMTSAQLSTLLSQDLTDVYDPGLAKGKSPFMGDSATVLSSTRGYVYRGQQTLNSGVTANIAVTPNLTLTDGSKKCIMTLVLPGSAQPPYDTAAFVLAYYAESSKNWQIKLGKQGVKPTLDTVSSTAGYCVVES